MTKHITLYDFIRDKYTDKYTFNEYEEIKDRVFNWVTSQRISNGGNYDWRDFQKLSSQKARALRRVKNRGLNLTQNWGIFERLWIKDNDSIDYVVGQSFNEELITLLECLSFGGS